MHKLKQLLDSGVISQAEFEAEKQKILNAPDSNGFDKKTMIIIGALALVLIGLVVVFLCTGGSDAEKVSDDTNAVDSTQQVVAPIDNGGTSPEPVVPSQPIGNHHYVLTNILPENYELIGGGMLLKDRTSYEFVLPENTSRWFLEFCFAQVAYSDFGMYNILNENLDTRNGLPGDILQKIPQPQGNVKCSVMILDEDNNRKFINLQQFESLYDVSFESQGLFELTSVLGPGKYYLAMRNSVAKRYNFKSEIVAIVDKNN